MKKYWWARVRISNDDYGRWVPTGQTDKLAAVDYMAAYPGANHVREWLLW